MRNSAIRIVLSKLNRSNTSNRHGIQVQIWKPLASWTLRSPWGKEFVNKPNCLDNVVFGHIEDVLIHYDLCRPTGNRLSQYSVTMTLHMDAGDTCLAHVEMPLDRGALRVVKRFFSAVEKRNARDYIDSQWLTHIYSFIPLGEALSEVG
jgi:hypothetical protein